MIEVTEWRGEARYMWVWDDNVNNKEKKKVVYISNNSTFPVLTVGQFDGVEFFKHAAEIEDEPRPMTQQELSWWLRDGKHREWTFDCVTACPYYNYRTSEADEPVEEIVMVRENNGKWVKPTISLLFV